MQKALPSAMPHVVNKDFNDLKDSKVNFAVRQSQLSMRQPQLSPCTCAGGVRRSREGDRSCEARPGSRLKEVIENDLQIGLVGNNAEEPISLYSNHFAHGDFR